MSLATAAKSARVNPLLTLAVRMTLHWIGWERLEAVFERLAIFVVAYPEAWMKCRGNMPALRAQVGKISIGEWAWVVDTFRLYAASKGLGKIVFIEQWSKDVDAMDAHLAIEEIIVLIKEAAR